MAEVPLELPTGRVVGKFIFEVQDNNDPGEEPQLVPVTGDVTIKSSIDNLRIFDPTLGKFITFRGPHKAIVDASGQLSTPDPATNAPMYPGMSLWSNDSDKLSVKGWTYTATFNLKTIDGKTLNLQPATFTLATGQEVDLADVVQVPATPGYGLPQAEGAALRAEAAAVESKSSSQQAAQAAQAAQASVAPSGPDVISWGDSMTAQGYPAILATAIARTVRNAGVGGESSQGIAARQGALPYLLLPVGNQIPESGAVKVSIVKPTNTWPLLQGDGIPDGAMVGNLAGVEGVLQLVQPSGPSYSHLADDYYTFTRSVPGIAKSVTRPEPFRTSFSEGRRKDIAVIWAGRNNYFSASRVLADVRAMVRHLDASQTRYLVLGVCNGRLEGSGTSGYVAIESLNSALSDEYGRRFIDLREYLVAYGLADAGITPTTGDEADTAADIIPNSLRVDAVHFTQAGRTIVANLVAKRLHELGWVDTYEPASYPAAPISHTNLVSNPELESDTSGWEASNSATITRTTAQAFSGYGSLQVNHSSNANSSARFGNANRIPVIGGQKITCRAMVKAPLGHEIRILIHLYGADTYSGNVQGFATGTGDWVAVQASGMLAANIDRAVAEVNKAGTAFNTDTIYIDSLDVWQ